MASDKRIVVIDTAQVRIEMHPNQLLTFFASSQFRLFGLTTAQIHRLIQEYEARTGNLASDL